jgi:ABC-type bacteriocin/lantibiotic exporter with double-glycine peptidase domain
MILSSESALLHFNSAEMKYQIVLQHSEEDRGAACIATVAKHEGRIIAISFVKKGYKN